MDKSRIFIADDDKVLLTLMMELLEDAGHLVISLKAPSKAYEEIALAMPDLLVLDIRLQYPDVGWAILSDLKANPKTANIPVVICSAAAKSISQHENVIKTTGCFVVEKPFNIEHFLSTVEQALLRSPHAATST